MMLDMLAAIPNPLQLYVPYMFSEKSYQTKSKMFQNALNKKIRPMNKD